MNQLTSLSFILSVLEYDVKLLPDTIMCSDCVSLNREIKSLDSDEEFWWRREMLQNRLFRLMENHFRLREETLRAMVETEER
jgi:hypothetical protein